MVHVPKQWIPLPMVQVPKPVITSMVVTIVLIVNSYG
jgi:hypothetical protein